jgi:putative restriction endonuclease
MPRPSKPVLLRIIVSSVAEAGWNVLYLDDRHPFRLQIYNDEESHRVRIYIWNITHGGGMARAPNEYRIQVTGVSGFEPEPAGKTLVLGWWDEAGLFAGFDFNRHRGKLGASPSLQIRRECLEQAYQSGFAPCLKENKEIAIAFRPDFLVEYIRQLESLHQFGETRTDLAVLESLAVDPNAINQADLQHVSTERRSVVRSVQQRLRAANFRSRVLTAYGYRCAFCGLQLNLVQAAHILPVNVEGSTDATYNGVAACYLHHVAYDRGLITFSETYIVRVNEIQMQRLIELHRDGGMSSFRKTLRPLIILPPAVSDRPHVEFVRAANDSRGWTANME